MNPKFLKENLTLSHFIMQVFSKIKPKLISILKDNLEKALIEQRDRIIGNKPYQRFSRIKRWGYTIRKYITTPLGNISNVRIPRMRDKDKEIRLFIDRYVHYTTDFINDVILAHALNMSTRKITVWFKSRLKDVVSYATFSRFIKVVEEEIDKIRNGPLPPDIEGLILDGIWGHIRIKKKKGVILVALGVDREGKIHLLDWELAEKESFNSYGVLLSRLKKRGLEKVKIIVGDGARGLPEAGKFVYPGSNFQYCLWHLSQTLMKQVSHLPPKIKDCFYNQFWEIFV
ncbi:MAG: transposase [Candidatus Marinimicrobia bacterium]|nr:transposase [Candidatus Neomarinimicrobiota bacterium]